MNKAPAIHCQFVQVGERRVFLRAAGRGPVLVLLHQSPESSASLVPWMRTLAAHFAVIAPDTPGFGHSDPLPLAQPTIPDLAAALGRLIATLGVGPVLLWGVHTGAAIAARLARDEPKRVAALVCDGLSAFSPEERQPLLDGYLPPFEPDWSGGHLHWLWARIREQTLFFPWHAKSAAARLPLPLATPERIHAQAMELLDAGDGYRAGYRAPLLHRHGAAGAAELRVPAALLYRRADVLRPHLDRLRALPDHVLAHEVADAEAQAAEAEAFFSLHAARARPLDDVVAAVDAATSPLKQVLQGPAGLRVWHIAGAWRPEDPTVELVLPEIGVPAAIPPDADPHHLTLVPEWPGHGASERGDAAPWIDGRWCADLDDELARLLGSFDDSTAPLRLAVRAERGVCGLAAQLALHLARRHPRLSLSLHLREPWRLGAHERAVFLAQLPDPAIHPQGAHLFAAWEWARLRHLFRPWQRPDAAACLMAPSPSPRNVHAEVVEMLRAGPMLAVLWQAALAVDLPELARQLRALDVTTMPLDAQAAAALADSTDDDPLDLPRDRPLDETTVPATLNGDPPWP
jgi:pimeloyl-ACP methyl ester carboxylesterase